MQNLSKFQNLSIVNQETVGKKFYNLKGIYINIVSEHVLINLFVNYDFVYYFSEITVIISCVEFL